MKRTDYQWFSHQEFLSESLHTDMLNLDNQFANKGLLINEDGNAINDLIDFTVKNRYKDNSVLKKLLPDPLIETISLLERQLISKGVTQPVLFNYKCMINPNPLPGMKAYGWHKDYNMISHITDVKKLWFTMLFLTDQICDSSFMCAPNAQGPELWNIGSKNKICSNMVVGHNMNLGHEYTVGKNNNVSVLYSRWFDAG